MAAIKNTKLTRTEYKAEVNKWIKNNPKKFEELRKTTKNKPWPAIQKLLEPKLGKPYWTEVKGSRAKTGLVPGKGEKGIEFRIYNEGGKAGFKSISTRKATRGTLQRRAAIADKSISLDEYKAIAKKHGFSEAEAVKHYEINQAKLKKLAGKTKTLKGTPLAYEHLTPNVSRAYGGLEHWRNIGLLGDAANNKKSDLLITKKTARLSGIPLTKEEAVLMDLREVKPLAAGRVRRNIEADLTSRNPVRARLRNKFVSKIDAPKRMSLAINGNDNGNGINGKNVKNGKLNGLTIGNGGKTRLADSALQIGSNIATGNYAGAAIGAGTLAGTQALRHSAVQKTVAKQITKLIAERGAKSAAKLIPGLDIALSGKESWDYLRQGKLDQAGIAALSGAIGWLPLVGDGISAALDLSNTGLDIARLQVPNKRSRRKLKIKT